MHCKNYYKMSDQEIDQRLEEIRYWLFNHNNSKHTSKALLALDVALCAKIIKKDNFINSVIIALT